MIPIFRIDKVIRATLMILIAYAGIVVVGVGLYRAEDIANTPSAVPVIGPGGGIAVWQHSVCTLRSTLPAEIFSKLAPHKAAYYYFRHPATYMAIAGCLGFLFGMTGLFFPRRTEPDPDPDPPDLWRTAYRDGPPPRSVQPVSPRTA